MRHGFHVGSHVFFFPFLVLIPHSSGRFPAPLPERQVAWLEAVHSNQAKETGFLRFTLPHRQGKGKVPKEGHLCVRLTLGCC